MLSTGLLIMLIGSIGIFLSSKFYNYITFVQIGIVVLGIIKSMYEMDKKCRMKNSYTILKYCNKIQGCMESHFDTAPLNIYLLETLRVSSLIHHS